MLASRAATGRSSHAGAQARLTASAASAEGDGDGASSRRPAQELRAFAHEPLHRRSPDRLGHGQDGGKDRDAHPHQKAGDREPQRETNLGCGHPAHDRSHGGAHAREGRASPEHAAGDAEDAAKRADRHGLGEQRPRDLAPAGAERAGEGEHAAALHHRRREGGRDEHRADEQGNPRERREVELEGAHHARRRGRAGPRLLDGHVRRDEEASGLRQAALVHTPAGDQLDAVDSADFPE